MCVSEPRDLRISKLLVESLPTTILTQMPSTSLRKVILVSKRGWGLDIFLPLVLGEKPRTPKNQLHSLFQLPDLQKVRQPEVAIATRVEAAEMP